MSKQASPSSIRNILIQMVTLVTLILSKMFFWRKKQRIWLIACGGERWGDNADAFWRYMNREHPEIRTIAILKNKSVMNPKEKNWIERNKLSTYIMIMQAEVLATTHNLSDIGPESIVFISKAKKVRLQHGVIAIKRIIADEARSGHYDLICASSLREKEVMTEEIGIKPELIVVTGLARHDLLSKRIKQKLFREGLLYIPTLRGWSDAEQRDAYENMLFSWIDLIDKDFALNIKLWLHPGWSRYGLSEMGLNYRGIDHYGSKQDPQRLICESSLLVTDYSSVFFDAALSGIPTVFYQPDRLLYFEKNGLFKDFLEQDLLLVVQNQDELLLQITKILTSSDYYEERLDQDQKWAYQYVETFDGNSCPRIYQQIMRIL